MKDKFNRFIADMHTHSYNSMDCDTPAELMYEAMKSKGISAYAITDHFDPENYTYDDIFGRIKNSNMDAIKLNSLSEDIEVLRGIELGEGYFSSELTNKALSMCEYDVVIGSVHSVHMDEYHDYCSEVDFSKLPYDTLIRYLDSYFDNVIKLAENVDIDILAHLTYPLRYIKGKYNIDVDLKQYYNKINYILNKIIKRNIALEINTSNCGSGYDEFMPTDEIIKMYKDLGGELITLGSDAHVPQNAGKYFDRAISFLKSIGIDKCCYYKNRQAYCYYL